MFITDDFIFIHFPKSGGTFVVKMLEQACNTCHKLSAHLILDDKVPNTDEPYGQHGGCEQIPDGWGEDRSLFTTIRNPLDGLVSRYEFKWWQSHPIVTTEEIIKEYPEFPNLSFQRYLDMANTLFLGKLTNNPINPNIGILSFQFLRFYFRNPYQLLTEIDDTYFQSGKWKEDMFDIKFLKMDRLNEELFSFLVDHGYSENKVTFIRDHMKVYPQEGGRSAEQQWQKYYTPELIEYIKKKERLLFEIFPSYLNLS
jgi:hypothetical protein